MMLRSLLLSLFLGLLLLNGRAAASEPKANGIENYQIILPDGTHTDGEEDEEDADDNTRGRDAETEEEAENHDDDDEQGGGGRGRGPCGAGVITFLPMMLGFVVTRPLKTRSTVWHRS